MGCDDYPEPLTREQQQKVDDAVRAVEEEINARVQKYRLQMEKLLEQGLVASVSELVSIVYFDNLPREQEIHEAAVDIMYSRKYGMPDSNWRLHANVVE